LTTRAPGGLLLSRANSSHTGVTIIMLRAALFSLGVCVSLAGYALGQEFPKPGPEHA
jgi:hypothetical protein